MTTESGPGPEEKEAEPSQTDVWIVDDNVSHITSLLRALNFSAPKGTNFQHFQEGEQAVEEFGKRAEEKSQMPNLILMDYKLDDYVENPKFRTGAEVIAELRRIAAENEIHLPEIAAFSTEKSYAEQLIQAGASTALSKMDYMAVVEHLKSRDN